MNNCTEREQPIVRSRSFMNLHKIYNVRKKDFIERYCEMEKLRLRARTPNSRFVEQYPALVLDLFNWSRARFIRTHNKAVSEGVIPPEIKDFESPDLGIPQELVK